MTNSKSTSLSAAFNQIKSLPKDEAVSLEKILNTVGDKGFGLFFIVLSLPSALPVPAAGYSTPFGVIIFILGLQLLLGKPAPALPAKAKGVKFNRNLIEKMTGTAEWFLRKAEHFVRPRLRWIDTPIGKICLAIIVLIMSVLMCLPIPTTNTFPAMVIFLIGIALAEDDGLFAIGAFVVGIFAVALYAFVIYIVITYGVEAVIEGKEMIKEWIKAQV